MATASHPSSFPVWSFGGRLAGGPAAVTIHAWSFDGNSSTEGAAAGTVRVIGATPPGSDGYAIPDPDPDSPLQVISAARSGDGLAVEVSYDECPIGAEYWVDLGAMADGQGQGKRLEPAPRLGLRLRDLRRLDFVHRPGGRVRRKPRRARGLLQLVRRGDRHRRLGVQHGETPR